MPDISIRVFSTKDRLIKYHNQVAGKIVQFALYVALFMILAAPANAATDQRVPMSNYALYNPSLGGLTFSYVTNAPATCDGFWELFYYYYYPHSFDYPQSTYTITGTPEETFAYSMCESDRTEWHHADSDVLSGYICNPPEYTTDASGFTYKKVDGFETNYMDRRGEYSFWCHTVWIQFSIYKRMPCENGQSRPCYTGKPAGMKGVGMCQEGTQECINHEWSTTCQDQVTPQEEKCDGHDYNCNGKNDDGCDPCKIDPICCGNALCLDCLKQQK